MNEKENTALVQKIYDSFAKGDIETILNNVTRDVEWGLEGPATIPFAGVRFGVDGVKQFFEKLTAAQTDMKLTIEQIIAQGDSVAMLGRSSFTARPGGHRSDLVIGHFFKIRNGKVSRFVDLADTAALVETYRSSASGSGA
jgi:ketosteroid isomerase-like protein